MAFSNLTLEVPSGQIACLYGPTRSGKTSALLIAGGQLKPTAGDVKLGDLSVVKAPMQARRLTGLSLIDGFNPLLDNLTVRENLLFQCRLYAVPNPTHRVDELLEQFDLKSVANDLEDTLLQPETFRVGLAMAVVHNPSVVLVDEPAHALTSQELKEQWWHVARLKAEGKTILIATHSLWVAQHSDIPFRLPQGKEIPADEFTAFGLTGD